MIYRPYTPADRDGCLAIFDSNADRFFSPGDRAAFARFLEAPAGFVGVLRDERRDRGGLRRDCSRKGGARCGADLGHGSCCPPRPRLGPPADEPADPGSHSRSAGAAGRGSQFKEKYVEVKRNFGVMRAVIRVRYTKDSAN
jgi:hypothetical protein